jgi:hypothetical protein
VQYWHRYVEHDVLAKILDRKDFRRWQKGRRR